MGHRAIVIVSPGGGKGIKGSYYLSDLSTTLSSLFLFCLHGESPPPGADDWHPSKTHRPGPGTEDRRCDSTFIKPANGTSPEASLSCPLVSRSQTFLPVSGRVEWKSSVEQSSGPVVQFSGPTRTHPLLLLMPTVHAGRMQVSINHFYTVQLTNRIHCWSDNY